MFCDCYKLFGFWKRVRVCGSVMVGGLEEDLEDEEERHGFLASLTG
jgi:hypothetical protein